MVREWSTCVPLAEGIVASVDRRPTRDGTIRWRARVRRRGLSESASFDTREEARLWAEEVERAIARGEWTRAVDDGRLDFSSLLCRFLAERRPSQDTRRQLAWWNDHLGSETVSGLTRRRILQLRHCLARESVRGGRSRSRSSATVNRYMAALSAFLSWALHHGYLENHVVRGVKPLAEAGRRFYCLSAEESQRLLSACRASGSFRLPTLVVLALASGATRGELLRLRWADLDMRRRQMSLGGSGRLKTRQVPLPTPVLTMLQQQAKVRHIDNDRVFANASGRCVFPRSAWRSALVATGIEGFRFHDLRHTAAARLAANGASLAEIAEVLGYRSLKSAARYSHLVESRPSPTLRRMQDQLFRS